MESGFGLIVAALFGPDGSEVHRRQGENAVHQELIGIGDFGDFSGPHIADVFLLGHGPGSREAVVVHQLEVLPVPIARQKRAPGDFALQGI